MRAKGFSLIELILVIVIIGILAGAMIPIFTTNRLEAQRNKAASDLDAIKSAAMMMHSDTGTWPPDGTTGEGFTGDTTVATVGWNGPYLAEWRNDPWGNAYTILISNVRELRAYSFGPNELDDTATSDDIVVIITLDNTR